MFLTGNESTIQGSKVAGRKPRYSIDRNCVMDYPTTSRITKKQEVKQHEPPHCSKSFAASRSIMRLSSMMLVAIVCWRLPQCLSSSQTHFFQQSTSPLRHSSTRQYVSQSEHPQQHPMNAPQRQIIEQLMRAEGFKRTHQQAQQQPFRPSNGAYLNQASSVHQKPASDRRASSDITEQQTANRVLVCYYTTRNAPPFWPNDAHGYVIPVDSVPSVFPHTPATGATSVSAEARNAAELGFSPLVQAGQVQYEARGPQQQSNEIGKGKLLFKSIHSAVGPALESGQAGSSLDTISEFATHQDGAGELFLLPSNNGNAPSSNKHLFEQVFASSKQSADVDQNNRVQPSSQHHSMLIFAGSSNNNKINKQPLAAYSLLNGFESVASSSPLEVSGGGGGVVHLPGATRTSREPTLPANQLTTTTTTTTSQNYSGGGNNGFAAKLDAATVYHQNHHNLERPAKHQEQQLVLSPSLSRAFIVGGSANNNNEVLLETKSQLFIPAAQATARVAADQQQLPALHHQQQLNSPSSNYLRQHQQQTTALSRQSAPLLAPSVRNKPLPVGAPPEQVPLGDFSFSGTVSSVSQVPLSPASSSLKSQQFIPSNHMMQQQLIVPSSTRYSKPAEEPAMLASKVATNTSGSVGHAASFSSALISSPLSSVFDVFGAASQYLMRFKPSSLISPSSFMLNTLAATNAAGHHLPGLRPQAPDANVSSTASLISLPSSLVIGSSSQQQMKLQSASAGAARSASSSENSSQREQQPVSFLSRFSVLHSNNQRREDVCGKTIQSPQRRIIGGEGARYGEFPYQVHIKIAKHQCGGALIDQQSIVTAAHCVYHFITRAPVNKLQIVIGAYDIEDEQYQEQPPQYFKVNKVKLHPNFKFSASHPDRYDIAILKLDKPVKYTDNVLPVCLPSRDFKLENLVGTVTGFGKTDPSLSNRYGTRLLQKVDVPIIENNECERWHRTRGIDLKIFPEMMCAGYEDGLKDACVGDSGGPLVVKTTSSANGSSRWTLAGITSAGFGCAQSRQPGIYHRVSHTVDWILENLD